MSMQTETFNSHRSILIVDDSSDVRAFFKVVADIHNISLNTAQNGQDALKKLAELESDPSVLFVDLNMPVMDGVTFLDEIHARGLAASSHIVILSGAEKNTFVPKRESSEWLQKPFDMDEIVSIMLKARRH